MLARQGEPATVASVSPDFGLLLSDGRRASLAGLEFPRAAGAARDAALTRLIAWLEDVQVFVEPLATAPVSLGELAGAGDRGLEQKAGRPRWFRSESC